MPTKNLYFTVDMNAMDCDTTIGGNSGFTWIINYKGLQLAFTIITYSAGGIADSRLSGRYILGSFRKWIESVTDRGLKYIFSARKIERDIRQLITEWNKYMFEHSCNVQGMNASVAIIIMTGNRYISFLTGASTVIRCTGHRAQVIMPDEEPIGSHSLCRIIVNRGRLRYGDIFVMCSNQCSNDNLLWYIKELVQRRRKYTRRHGRGMAGRDIMMCILGMLKKSSVRMNTVAVLCCERTE